MSERNAALASFLRSRRQRLTPEQVGLPQSGRRRISTLRREDVAWLADVGITWYTWLEQGRPIKMAAETLDRIGTALRLDSSETEYLQKLVHTRTNQHLPSDEAVDPRVSLLVHVFTVGYAFVMGPRWDVLTANERYADLVLLGRERGRFGRNGLWMMFADERAREVFPDWEGIARRMVAAFRVEYADYAGDERFAALIDALTLKSVRFAEMWADVDVLSLKHWKVGEIRDPISGVVGNFDTVSLAIPDSPGQTLVFLVPAGAPQPMNACR